MAYEMNSDSSKFAHCYQGKANVKSDSSTDVTKQTFRLQSKRKNRKSTCIGCFPIGRMGQLWIQ